MFKGLVTTGGRNNKCRLMAANLTIIQSAYLLITDGKILLTLTDLYN